MSSGQQWVADQEQDRQYASEKSRGKVMRAELDSMTDHALYEYFLCMLHHLNSTNELRLTKSEHQNLDNLKNLLLRVFNAK